MLDGEIWMTVSYVPTVEDGLVYVRYLAANSPQIQATLRNSMRTAYVVSASVAIPLIIAAVLSRTQGGAWLEPYLHYGLRVVLVMGLLFLAATA